MKLRHAAALALVGWYLAVYVNPEGGCIGCQHPITPVGVWGFYPNASNCQAARRKMMTLLADNEKHLEKYRKGEWVVELGTSCDSSDKAREQVKFLSPSEKNWIIRYGIP